jgi:hypothetical protein
MHMCITTRIGSSLPDLFTTSWSPYHSDLCQFKITMLAPLQWAHQTFSSFLCLLMCSPLSVGAMSNNITAFC